MERSAVISRGVPAAISPRRTIGVLRLFREMTFTMYLVGLLPRHFRGDIEPQLQLKYTLRRLLAGSVLVLFVIGYLFHFTSATVYNVTHHGGFFGFFANCGYVIRNCFSLVTLLYFIVFQRVLLRIVLDGSRIFDHVPPEFTRPVRRATVLSVIFNVAGFVGLWNATAYALFGNIQRYFNYYLYKGDVSNGTIPIQLGYVLGVTDVTVYTIMSITMTFIISFHACLSLYLCGLCATFVSVIRKESDKSVIAASDIKLLRRFFTRLSEVLNRFDRVSNPMVFCWYLNIVVNLVLSTPGILLGIQKGSPFDYCYMLVDLLIMLTVLVCLTFSLADSESLLKSCYIYAIKAATKVDCFDEGVNHSAYLLMDSIKSSNVSLTGCRCFVVKRGLVLGIITMVSSYIIVVYQYIKDAV